MNEEQKPDLVKLACKIVWRLNMLCDRSDTSCNELKALTERVRDALEADVKRAQWLLLDDVRSFLDGSSEIHEDIRNVLQMFFYYVHLQSGANDENGNVWWTQVAD